MSYGVVICPACRRAKGADLANATTKCLDCGKVMKLDSVKIWATTEHADELPELVGQVHTQAQGQQYEPPEEKPRQAKKKPARSLNSKRERLLMDTAVRLTLESGTFTHAQFFQALQGAMEKVTEEESDKSIAFLQTRCLIIEKRPGRFQAVSEGASPGEL
jgi:hypothetical protein